MSINNLWEAEQGFFPLYSLYLLVFRRRLSVKHRLQTGHISCATISQNRVSTANSKEFN